MQAAIQAGEARLDGECRLLVRKRGTWLLIRVMAEGDRKLVVNVVDDIYEAISKATLS